MFFLVTAWRLTFLPFLSAGHGLTNGLGRTRDMLTIGGGTFETGLFEASFCNFSEIFDAFKSAKVFADSPST